MKMVALPPQTKLDDFVKHTCGLPKNSGRAHALKACRFVNEKTRACSKIGACRHKV
jgi:hypothetical protein